MHITLISTDDEIWASGMRSISATLRHAGHETTMIFAGSADAPIDARAIEGIASLARRSDIIGVSSMSRGCERAKTLIEGLRPLNTLIVWGGMHPTLNPEDCAAHADLVCRGEGELFMLDLVERVAVGRDHHDILNGAYRANGRVVLNPLRPLIADLDTLPFPDFAFESEHCLDSDGRIISNVRMRKTTKVLLSGSRGCANSCTYCSNAQLKSLYRGNGPFTRKMSLHHFIEAAAHCRAVFPKAREFYFIDEDFFSRSSEEMQQLADTYPAAVGLPFEVMASPRQITEAKVAFAVKAGMWRIMVGLESGSERTRKQVFNRHVTDDIQLRAANAISRFDGLVAYYYLILGNPYEEREDMLDGIGLLKSMPTSFFLRTYNLVFIPGTKLYERACSDGIIGGVTDSASHIDFLSGFDPGGHEWKRKNLYLNSLIALMTGKFTRLRMGCVPRVLATIATNQRIVDHCERHPWIGETMVKAAHAGLRIRRAVLELATRVLGDARILYNRRVASRQTAG